MAEFHETWHVTGVFIAVLFTVMFRTFAYVWLIYGIQESGTTDNIPYETLLLDFLAVAVLIVIATMYHYWPHLALYLTQMSLISYITFIKYIN